MKKALTIVIFILLLVISVSCGTVGGGTVTDQNGTQQNNQNEQNTQSGSYPRVTYYDGKDGYKWAAALQNAHLTYNYGEDRNDGRGVVSYQFEFLNCENCHYHKRYTLVGYDEAYNGTLTEADDHIGIVFENGKCVYYDFYRKLIVDDFPFLEVYEDKTFLPENLGSATFGIYNATKDFESGSKKQGNTDIVCERTEFQPTTTLCGSAKGYELSKKMIYHGKSDHTSEFTSTKFFYDTDTEIGLYAEFYMEDDPKVKLDEAAGESYYEYRSELSSVVEVTGYETGKVSPSDVKAKIDEVMKGHETEYKHVSYSEYSDIFA